MHRFLAGIIAIAAVLTLQQAGAYEHWGDGCEGSGCHDDFMSSGYQSTSTGAGWPASPHTVHSSAAYMAADCGLCHRDIDGGDPWINWSDGTSSNGEFGCIGCHGVMDGAPVPSGAGLVLHHERAGITTCTSTCHTGLTDPPGEHTDPPYYGTGDTVVVHACNQDLSEDWNGDGIGLDNDGDLFWDTADPDCGGWIFADGFDDGTADAWAAP